MNNSNTALNKKSFYNKKVSMIINFVLLLVILFMGVLLWNLKTDNNNLNNILASDNSNPQALIQKQANQIIAKVKNLMKVPTNENPTIATVNNPSAVQRESPFFKSAQYGDKVLFYVKNSLVILYRPNTNKIIASGPLTFSNTKPIK